ncbi:type VI secretion system tube protein Hcp [Bosea sp. (in: a-proteobacteria)]|uniref:type VI secretion system tube protein Hcp n=1 Tax=Bosea sp. (in: a-proteobacteria) TaxID=1871050 RepID=UPI002FC91CE5
MPIHVRFSSPISDSCEAVSAQLAHSRPTVAPGGIATQAQPEDVTFTKEHDFLSAKLMMHANDGTQFETVTIEYRKQGSPTPYLIYKLSKTIITGYSFTSPGGSPPYETIGLNAASVSWRLFS